MAIHKTEGLLLRSRDYGESDKIVTVLTPEFGKRGVLARGAKKQKNRFHAATQPLTHGYYVIQIGKGLAGLYQADLMDSFRNIKKDLYRLANASYIVELTDKVTTEEAQPSAGLFNLLYKSLVGINQGKTPQAVKQIFEIKMLHTMGISPNLKACSVCGEWQDPMVMSISSGGILCPKHKVQDPYSVKISHRALKIMLAFQEIPIDRLGQISVKPETLQEIKTILDSYYSFHSGVFLKSKTFLDQLEKMSNLE